MKRLTSLLTSFALSAFPAPLLADVIQGALMSGSDRLVAFSLLDPALPTAASIASAKLMDRAGHGDDPAVIKNDIQVRPFLRHDGNLNGGMPGDHLSIGPLTFAIDEAYRAVSGPLVGVTADAVHRRALGGGLALDLRAGISLGFSPKHDLQKHAATAEGCLRQKLSPATFVHGCLQATWSKWDLGRSSRLSALAGATHLFALGRTRHQVTAELRRDHHLSIAGSKPAGQAIGSLKLASAFSNGGSTMIGVDLGEPVQSRSVMRKRISVGYSRKIAGQPTGISLSWQTNEGGLFLGQTRKEEIISATIRRSVGKATVVTVGASKTNSTADSLDDVAFDAGVSWKF